MLFAEVFAIQLILLHGPDGQELWINPENIATVRAPRKGEDHFSKEIKCIINTDDGKFTAVVEPCSLVREMGGTK